MSPGDAEFTTLGDWLPYASSLKGNGASISKYLSPNPRAI